MMGLQNLAQLTSSQIVNCFVLGIGIAALAGIASTVAGRRSSGMRFAIWFAALLGIASVFFISHPTAHRAALARAGAPEISLRPEWALYIFVGWTFFALIGLARVARGLWRVRLLKTSCAPAEPEMAAWIRETLPAISRRFRLCTSDRLRVPAALGFFNPVIALPKWTISELSPEELSTVVLHEAAHLQRWDDWTNLFQKVVRALLFFHPAVWWIDSRLSIEREMSCDDMVLARSRSARQYAACLVSLAEKTQAHRSLALVQAAVNQLKHTAKRITKILDGNQRTATPLLKPAAAALVVFGAVSFVAVQHAPQLVSFTEQPRASASTSKQFDYVANADALRAKAISASMNLGSVAALPSGLKTRATQQRKAIPRVQPKASREPLPMEEARNQFERTNTSPAVVNAAVSDEAVPSFVYLVTQTEQYDSFGNVMLTTSVWRIRVMKPAPAQAHSPVLPNRT